MGGQILLARANVEPGPLVQDHTADLSALTNPFRQNRDVGNGFPGRDPFENRSRPDRDAREIVTARKTVSIRNIYNPLALERHVGAVLGLAQRQGHIVLGPEMFIEQPSQLNIGQQVAAVGNEVLLAQQ